MPSSSTRVSPEKRLNGKPDALKEARPVWGEVQRNVPVVTQATRSAPTPRQACEASPEDIAVTKQLIAAGTLLEGALVDHLIIGDQRFLSLREHLELTEPKRGKEEEA
jgi:hypothetical protein